MRRYQREDGRMPPPAKLGRDMAGSGEAAAKYIQHRGTETAQRCTERRGDPAGRPYIRNDVGEEESEGVHALSVAQGSVQKRNICFDFE